MMHQRLLSFVYETPWAILPAKLHAIVDLVQRHVAGQEPTREFLAAVKRESQPTYEAARRAAAQTGGAVAVIPITGTLIPHGDMIAESSGATSADRIAGDFRAALANPTVGAIVFAIDSPGGSVYGIDELASEIYNARGQKPTVAVASHLAASAAYYLATAAKEVVVSPSAEVGSIGVFTAHEDWSGAYESAGVKTTLISAGKYKVEGNPFQPLTAEGRAAIQSRVDDYYGMFVKAVARGRGVSQTAVREGFGEGRVVGAQEAVKLGMADRIDTLEAVVAGMLPAGDRGSGRAQLTQELADDYEIGARLLREGVDKFLQAAVEPAADGQDDTETRRRRLRLHAHTD